LSESPQDDKKFDWQEEVIVSEKADGSLINVYFYQGSWMISTRGSFADGQINDSQFTWAQLVLSRLNTKLLNKELTYTFELCSPYNKVVRIYPETSLFLLAVFRGWEELSFVEVQSESTRIGIGIPETFALFIIIESSASHPSTSDYTNSVITEIFHLLRMSFLLL
jgi:RNA ligase